MVSPADNDVPEIIERFPDPIIRYEESEKEPVIRWANDRAKNLFGAVATEEHPLSDVLSGFDVEGDERTVVDVDDVDQQVAVLETDGAPQTFYLRRVVAGTDGSGRSGYLVFTDVTACVEGGDRGDEKELESPTGEQLLSVLSHDLRNPLEVAAFRLEAARETGDGIHFEKVELALDRIETLIQDVRMVAQGDAIVETTTSVALETVATDAWSTVQTGSATLRIDETATIEADEGRLRQVFENAFRNSVEHAGPDVTVCIGLLADATGFYVADDGPGIPDEDRDAVFEPGVSLQEGNTGLGLTIIERIAEVHSWDVGIATADGGGTRLEFSGVNVLD